MGLLEHAGIWMPMNKLDGVVLGEVSRRVPQLDRLRITLESYTRDTLSRGDSKCERLRHRRHDLKESRGRPRTAVGTG